MSKVQCPKSKVLRLALAALLVFAPIGLFPGSVAQATVNEVTSANRYTGNGSTTAFTYGFKIFLNTDIEVLVDGVVKTLTTDYTVSGLGASDGGTVTFVTAPASGKAITLLRKQKVEQQSDYVPNETFSATAERIEKDLDKLVMQVQMLKEQIARASKLPKKSTLTGIDLPEPGADKFIKWNAGGTALEAVIGTTAFAADPAACPAGQYVTDQNASGVLTCAQADFNQLAGMATDAQVPNTITLDNLTQITTRAISDTTGILSTARGGTGSAFFSIAGPTVARVYTFPDSAATMLYSGGALGTPASGVATNLTGTAAGLTTGNVTTNANLTGHVTSTGNAAVLGSFTVGQLNTAISDADVATGGGTATGTNTGDQTITLTGDVTGSGTGSFATTIAADSVALGTDTTGSYVSSATANQGLLLTGTEGASLGLIDCAANEILKRNAGDTAWVCAADSTGGTPSFDAITVGTNTTAAMVVGTGASLGVSGSGTIAATTVVTNANLTGHVTSTGNAAVLGSFTLAQLNTAISDADVPSVPNKVTANTTVTNTTVETTLYTFSVPGGTLSTDNTLRLTLFGSLDGVAGSSNITIRLKYGAATLTTAVFSRGGSNQGFELVAHLSGDGTTSAQAGSLRFQAGENVSGVTVSNGGTSAIDSTAAQNIVVTVQWVEAQAGNNITLRYAILEKLS